MRRGEFHVSKKSGPNISEDRRGTVRLFIRCDVNEAVEVRDVTKMFGLTLADVLMIGCAVIRKHSPTDKQ